MFGVTQLGRDGAGTRWVPGPPPPLAPWHEGSQFLMFQRQTTLSRRLPTFQRLLPLVGTGLFFLVASSTLHSPQALVPCTGALEHAQGCPWFLSLPEPVKASVPCDAHGAELTRHRKARASFLSMPSLSSLTHLTHLLGHNSSEFCCCCGC